MAHARGVWCLVNSRRASGVGRVRCEGVRRDRWWVPMFSGPERCCLTPIRPPVSSARSSTTRGGVVPFERWVSAAGCSDFISGSVRCSAPNTYRDSARRDGAAVPRSRNSSVPSYRPPQAATCSVPAGSVRSRLGGGAEQPRGRSIVWSGDGCPFTRGGSRDRAVDEFNRRVRALPLRTS